MKHVLITGGLGYVGGRILEAFVATGRYHLTVVSRKSAISHTDYFDVSGIRLMDSGVLVKSDPADLKGFDAIVHLAAYNEIDCAADPVGAVEFNVVDSLKLLQLAIQAGVRQFLYFSTAHVYGAPLQGQITEDNLPRPVHPYAITHRAFEDFVLAARDRKQIDGIVVRLSNSFGYPAWHDVNRWTLLVNDLCREAVTRGSLTLKSAGTQERDFVCLHDVADATDFLLRDPAVTATDGLFNLGGNLTMTVRQMTELIASRCQEVLGYKPVLQIPAEGHQESHLSLPLRYSSAKLQEAGFTWQGNMHREIDELLRFCARHFAVPQEG